MNLRTRIEVIEKNQRAYQAVESLKKLMNALKDYETDITISKELEYFINQAEIVLNESNWNLIAARRVVAQLTREFADISPEYIAERVSKYTSVSPEQIMSDVAREYKVDESMLM
jgi:hypothetical protein